MTEFQPNTEGIWSGVPEEIYHDHKATPEVNRGMIVEMIARSPAHVKCMMEGKKPRKVTAAMETGTLIDHALLEPHRFKEGVSHWIRPEGLNLTTKEGIQWKKDHPGLPYLQARNESANLASAEDIDNMIAAVMKDPVGRRIIEQSFKQESAFALDKETGLLRKCRLDTRLVDNSGRLTITDLKSTFIGGTSDETWARHCARMGYWIQAPWYSGIVKDLFNEDPFFLFLVVERKPPYAVRVFQIHEEGVHAGNEACKRAMHKIAECKQKNEWPGYKDPGGIKTIKLPRWVLEPKDEE